MDNKMEMIRIELKELLASGFRISVVGREANVSKAMMSMYMTGQRNATPETVDRIDSALTTILGGRR
jgi:predicted transcriptional regulator